MQTHDLRQLSSQSVIAHRRSGLDLAHQQMHIGRRSRQRLDQRIVERTRAQLTQSGSRRRVTHQAACQRAAPSGMLSEHQPQFCRQALGPRLHGEGLLGAGQAGQVDQHRQTLPLFGLRRLEHRKAHGQAQHTGGVPVKALHPLKAAVFAEGLGLWPQVFAHVRTPRPNGSTRQPS